MIELLVVLGLCVAIKVWLDPWVSPESPTDRERREWMRDRARQIAGRDV
jgi:hypothetical protein